MTEDLYIKKEDGTFEKYREPEPRFKNCLYIKEGNRYVPWSMNLRYHDLPEGIWVIHKTTYGKSYTNGKYLRDQFMCTKVSDIQDAPSVAELASWQKLADYLCKHWEEVDKTCVNDMCYSIIGVLMQYKEEENNN